MYSMYTESVTQSISALPYIGKTVVIVNINAIYNEDTMVVFHDMLNGYGSVGDNEETRDYVTMLYSSTHFDDNTLKELDYVASDIVLNIIRKRGLSILDITMTFKLSVMDDKIIVEVFCYKN